MSKKSKKYNDNMTVTEHIDLSESMCDKNPNVYTISGMKTRNLHKAMYRMIELTTILEKELETMKKKSKKFKKKIKKGNKC